MWTQRLPSPVCLRRPIPPRSCPAKAREQSHRGDYGSDRGMAHLYAPLVLEKTASEVFFTASKKGGPATNSSQSSSAFAAKQTSRLQRPQRGYTHRASRNRALLSS